MLSFQSLIKSALIGLCLKLANLHKNYTTFHKEKWTLFSVRGHRYSGSNPVPLSQSRDRWSQSWASAVFDFL